jgi:hypothetical protein
VFRTVFIQCVRQVNMNYRILCSNQVITRRHFLSPQLLGWPFCSRRVASAIRTFFLQKIVELPWQSFQKCINQWNNIVTADICIDWIMITQAKHSFIGWNRQCRLPGVLWRRKLLSRYRRRHMALIPMRNAGTTGGSQSEPLFTHAF